MKNRTLRRWAEGICHLNGRKSVRGNINIWVLFTYSKSSFNLENDVICMHMCVTTKLLSVARSLQLWYSWWMAFLGYVVLHHWSKNSVLRDPHSLLYQLQFLKDLLHWHQLDFPEFSYKKYGCYIDCLFDEFWNVLLKELSFWSSYHKTNIYGASALNELANDI